MDGSWRGTEGLNGGRNWDLLAAEDGPLQWTVDASRGLIQGPLDLEFLRDRRLCLSLAPGQMALLVDQDIVKAVYLDGGHFLDIGAGEGRIHPDCQLIFLATDQPIKLNWPAGRSLRIGRDPGIALIGHCTLALTGPQRFFETFLCGTDGIDQDFTLRLIEQMVHGALEEILSDFTDAIGETLSVDVQSRLTNLSPADLEDELGASGLACTHLAIYTAAPPTMEGQVREPVPETAGHRSEDAHNGPVRDLVGPPVSS
jgi:hypothetical protein